MLSTIPFAVVQIPLLDGQPAQGPEASAIGAISSFTGLAAYCAYQVREEEVTVCTLWVDNLPVVSVNMRN
jgi:hypothetical protein